IITNIGMDHTDLLGNSLEQIAGEKAGIIKPGVPVVIGENQPETKPVFSEIAANLNSEIIFAEEAKTENLNSDLKGDYQVKNIKTVLTAIQQLNKNSSWNISQENIKQGLLKVKANTGIRGRCDILQQEPNVICDTAHNAEGLIYALTQLANEKFDTLHIVMGVVSDKDLDKILPLFPKKAKYYFCKPN